MVDAWARQAIGREQNRTWPDQTQQGIDPRHRTVGAMAKAPDVFPKLMVRGYMHTLEVPNATQAAPAAPVLNSASQKVQSGQAVKTTTSLEFMFNPFMIAGNYAVNESALPGTALDISQIGQPSGKNGPTYSWDMYFDRTYEVMAGSRYGVLTDVMALERMGQMTNENPVMVPSLIQVFFSEYLRFKASFLGFSVKYTHFSNWMVPMRCVVSVNVQRQPANIDMAQFQTYYTKTGEENAAEEKKDTPGAPPPPATTPSATTTTTTTRPTDLGK